MLALLFRIGGRFRFRRSDFPFDETIQFLTPYRDPLKQVIINLVDRQKHKVQTPARANNHIPHKIEHSGDKHSATPQRGVALIYADTEARYRENLAAKGGELKIGSDHELAAFIEKKIGEEGYSPAAVVGEIKRLGLTFKTEISEKTIYNYIDKGIFFGISRESLPEKGKRKRKYEKVKRKKSARAPQGESIERRDPEIDERKTFGHWEGDCVCGKKKTKEALFVLSERLTRQEIIMKIPDQTAASVVAALNKLERRYGKRFSKIFKSITFDNGSEFADCAGIEKSIYGKNRKRTKVYYCHPYSAFERGTNENINRMIRRFLPKGTDFRKVTAAYILRVETWINNYPREILGFASSNDLFAAHLAAA